jgi:hypothetical protein
VFGSDRELSKENVSISQVTVGSSFRSFVSELFGNFKSLFRQKLFIFVEATGKKY